MSDNKPKIGVYAGTFDPVTKGHMDIVVRAAKVVDKLVVAVAENAGKSPRFTVAERVDMVRHDIAALGALPVEVEIHSFDNLLMDFAEKVGASSIIRGLRAVSDFEYEFQMAGMNRRLKPEIEAMFLMASDKHQFISSRFVKEIADLGGDITPFVSTYVSDKLKK